MYPISIGVVLSAMLFFGSGAQDVKRLRLLCPFEKIDARGKVKLGVESISAFALAVTGEHQCQENLHLFVWANFAPDNSPVKMVRSSGNQFKRTEIQNVLEMQDVVYTVDIQSSLQTEIRPFGKRKVIYFPDPGCVVYHAPVDGTQGIQWTFYNNCHTHGQIIVKFSFRSSDGYVTALPEALTAIPFRFEQDEGLNPTPVSWSARFRDRPDRKGWAILDEPEQTYHREAWGLINALENITLPLIVAPDNQNVDSREK
jgi:hypothetical protein